MFMAHGPLRRYGWILVGLVEGLHYLIDLVQTQFNSKESMSTQVSYIISFV